MLTRLPFSAFFLCVGISGSLRYAGLVRWCNGSTRVFGALCHGSNPCRTASFAEQNEGFKPPYKHFANNLAESKECGSAMKYPVKIKYRGKVWARIYANEQGYRLYWRAIFGNWAGPLTFHVLGRTLFIAMKTSVRLLQLMTGSILLASTSFTFAGTWSDPFSGSVLGSEWRGDRDYFSIVDGALKGVSAEPVAPVPLHQVEVGTNWGDYTVQCRIDVVTPNLLVCTKGALILRDNGTEGYVFALHVATKTIEVYRLSDHEMLLSLDAPLELKTWYLVRAELQGSTMSYFVDNHFIGTVTDDRSLSGAVGVAVQDTLETLFDDFTVTGPDIPSNRLELSVGQKTTLSWPSFLTNYVLKTTSDLSATGAWSTVTNTPVSISGQLTVTLDPSPGNHFYILAPKSP